MKSAFFLSCVLFVTCGEEWEVVPGPVGGPTTTADKKNIFVMRADGSVIGGSSSPWGGDSLSATLQPGDTVVVPEKAISGSKNWQNIFMTAQLALTAVSTTFIALHY